MLTCSGLSASSFFFSTRAATFSRLAGKVLGHVGRRELLALHEGVHQAQRVLAGELPARAGAAIAARFRPAKSAEHRYGSLPLPWHSPNSSVSSAEWCRARNLFFSTSPRPFLAASALGAAASMNAFVDRDHGNISPEIPWVAAAVGCGALCESSSGDTRFRRAMSATGMTLAGAAESGSRKGPGCTQ